MAATDQEYHTEFGSRLRAARVLRGMSITDLAKAVKVSDEYVRLYEEGSDAMPFLTAWRATRVLDVPLGFFTIKYDAVRVADGQAGERFFENDRAADRNRPLSEPKIVWAMQNLANSIAEVVEAETGASAEGYHSVPRTTPDNGPPG